MTSDAVYRWTSGDWFREILIPSPNRVVVYIGASSVIILTLLLDVFYKSLVRPLGDAIKAF